MKPYLKAALVADALNLGPHWVYNQSKIARLYPNGVKAFTDPASSYHKGKTAGQLTHTGDQIYFLQQAIDGNNGVYDADVWRDFWLAKMTDYSGYLDNATKVTLSNKGLVPSDSDEISGVGRIAAILDLELGLDESIEAARSQTSLSHGSEEVVELADFMIRTIFHVRNGVSFSQAFQKAADDGAYLALDPQKHLSAAKRATSDNHLQSASDFGLTCHFPEAFPLTLYYAVHFDSSFEECLSLNALAGGDNTARGILLALLFVARDGDVGANLSSGIRLATEAEKISFSKGGNQINIPGNQGALSGVLEMPDGECQATAIFAHCFTCGKDFLPEKRITQALAVQGIAVLRIDFTGLGSSEGDFGKTSFLTNLDDLIAAAEWLGLQLEKPSLLVGHSLGGAAVLAAAKKISSVKAVATIGAPSDPGHVTHLFENDLEEIEREGEAEVKLAGRPFTIGKRFLDDLQMHNQKETLQNLNGVAALIMHSPDDQTVPLENAGYIYSALNHPKSFAALTGADHLLTAQRDAHFALRHDTVVLSTDICLREGFFDSLCGKSDVSHFPPSFSMALAVEVEFSARCFVDECPVWRSGRVFPNIP